MEEGIPSISSGSVGSRFVSQTDLDNAKAVRDEQWKAAYARLGQEPPPRPEVDTNYDGRSLYERLQTQKTAKQEKWEDEHRLSKQFRALEEDEILFLDAVREEKQKEERVRQDKDSEEVDAFKQAVAAREQAKHSPPSIPSSSCSVPPVHVNPGLKVEIRQGLPLGSGPTASAPSLPPKQKLTGGKKDQKTLLKGIVKKKPANVRLPQTSIAGPPKIASEDRAATSAATRKRTIDAGAPTESVSLVESSQPKRIKTDANGGPSS